MRIQHNVMAMNAYRNYSHNTSALSKNLERLSSGYKINRAGDDAAGLAISEKMRAQITGLEAAQKNVKDGISLVNTAEGAMQEIQDMLNRMVYLAQESANGTYDDAVDRANLQKELDQLNSEIDRIADSANFNGIKLLDGSKDQGGLSQTIAGLDRILGGKTGTLGTTVDEVGTKTFLDGSSTSAANTVFEMDFTGLSGTVDPAATAVTAVYKSSAVTATTLGTAAANKISIGGVDITVDDTDTIDTLLGKLNADTTLNAAWTFSKNGDDIVAEAKTAGALGSAGAPTTALANGMTQVTEGKDATAATATITVDTTAGGDATNVAIGSHAGQDITGTNATGTDATNGYSWATANDGGVYTVTVTTDAKGTAANGTNDGLTFAGGEDAVKAQYKLADVADALKTATSASGTLTIGGQGYTVTHADTDLEGQLNDWVTAYNADAANTEWTASVSADKTSITYTAKQAGALATTGATAPTGATVVTAGADAGGAPALTFDVTIGETTVTGVSVAADATAKELAEAVLAAMNGGTAATTITGYDLLGDGSALYDVEATATGLKFTLTSDPTEENIKGNFDWNIDNIAGGEVKGNHTGGTKVTTPGAVASSALPANTVFELKDTDITDGTKITLTANDGTKKTVTLAVGKDSEQTGADVVDLKHMEAGTIDMNDALSRISQKLGGKVGNLVVGVNDQGNNHGKLGLTVKRDGGDGYTTIEDLAAVFSLETTTAVDKTKGLTLQIGDTSDSYNQLTVSIGNMHAAALGTAGLNIGNQKGAADAVDKIKAAINQVSSIRGTLGATSNRLDHTANNLSVMRENITDAESSIRDTDIAEEMMAYTKNNILVQSAQAMLAQANQVPQGVLQLLQ